MENKKSGLVEKGGEGKILSQLSIENKTKKNYIEEKKVGKESKQLIL